MKRCSRKRRFVMKKHSVALLAVVAVMLNGCAKKADVEAERAAILETDAQWGAALTAKDPVAYSSFFAADAIVMPPHLPILVGADAISAWATESMAFPGFAVTWTTTSTEVAGSGDMGYTLGTFVFQMSLPDGSTLTDNGKFTTIWKKQADGSWKVAVDTFNSDVPMVEMAAPSDTTAAPSQ
jgi:ketosteroid isomerase-like protein